MTLTSRDFYIGNSIFQTIIVVLTIIGLIIEFNQNISSVPVMIIGYVIASIVLANQLYKSAHAEKVAVVYEPTKRVRVVLSMLFYYYLFSISMEAPVLGFWLALACGYFITMPYLMLITTNLAVNIVFIYSVVVTYINEGTIYLFGYQYYGAIDLLFTISLGYALAVYVYGTVNPKKVMYKNAYTGIVGIVAFVAISGVTSAMAMIAATWNALYRTQIVYVNAVSLKHQLNAEKTAYIHYLESAYIEQLKRTIQDSMKKRFQFVQSTWTKRFFKRGIDESIMMTYYTSMYCMTYALLSLCFAYVLTFMMAIVHSIVIGIFKIVYEVTKRLRMKFEALYRQKHGVETVCDCCYEKTDLPYYRCSTCARLHDIRPGKFGVWKYRCACGTKLPNTFTTHRYELQAYCQSCEEPYANRESAPVVVPVVGSQGVGKTTNILFSLQHILANAQQSNCYFVSEEQQLAYDQLQRAPILPTPNGLPESTTLHFKMKRGTPSTSLHIFDASGHMYDSVDEMRHLKYLSYANGYMFLLDGSYLDDEFSDIDDTLERFITYLQQQSNDKAETKFNVPIAFVFNKIDKTSATFHEHNAKQWLAQNGFEHIVRKIDMTFTNYAFFSATSYGNVQEHHPMKAYQWLLQQCSNVKVEVKM